MNEKKPKLAEQLFDYFSSNRGIWTVKGEIIRMRWLNQDGVPYMPTTVARTLNVMESEKKYIAVRPAGRNTVEYTFIKPIERERYIPWSERSNDEKDVIFAGYERPQPTLL